MISAAQLRAARGLMDWSRGDLSKAAKISQETIKNIEHGIFRPQEETESSIMTAFAAHGVEFIENEGVRKNMNKVYTFEGVEGFKNFMDDVYETSRDLDARGDTEKPTCISYVNDRFFEKYLGDFLSFHIKRMNMIRNCKIRILIEDIPSTYTDEERKTSSYREYRKHALGVAGNVPFYVYGDKLAILVFEDLKDPQIVVISSVAVAKAYRDQFNVMWKAAAPLENI